MKDQWPSAGWREHEGFPEADVLHSFGLAFDEPLSSATYTIQLDVQGAFLYGVGEGSSVLYRYLCVFMVMCLDYIKRYYLCKQNKKTASDVTQSDHHGHVIVKL